MRRVDDAWCESLVDESVNGGTPVVVSTADGAVHVIYRGAETGRLFHAVAVP